MTVGKNRNLGTAKAAKNDEFYTQYTDIEREVLAYVDFNPDVFRGKTVLLPCDDPEWSNFTKFFAQKFTALGLEKVISTSYSKDGTPGRVFTLTDEDTNDDGRIDIEDYRWEYLTGDGDFRSDEVRALRDQADFVVTNPPFSLFREFLAWLREDESLRFLMIANKNAITYKQVFPLIKADKLWSGVTSWSGGMWFSLPADAEKIDRVDGDILMGNVPSIWFTNMDHMRRHEPLQLMTMANNLRYNSKFAGMVEYERYDNYDAIEVPQTKAIPSDYDGLMGVPITFLEKYNPEQFEIIGSFNAGAHGEELGSVDTEILTKGKVMMWNGPVVNKKALYKRIIIKHRKAAQ